MSDAAGEPPGVYHHHLRQEVDDRSISAPPVLELTAKVSMLQAIRNCLREMCFLFCIERVQRALQDAGPDAFSCSPHAFDCVRITPQTLFSFRPPLEDIRCDDMYEQFYENAQVSHSTSSYAARVCKLLLER